MGYISDIRWLTSKEVAERLRVSSQTVLNFVERGWLNGSKNAPGKIRSPYLFTEEDVNKFVHEFYPDVHGRWHPRTSASAPVEPKQETTVKQSETDADKIVSAIDRLTQEIRILVDSLTR